MVSIQVIDNINTLQPVVPRTLTDDFIGLFTSKAPCPNLERLVLSNSIDRKVFYFENNTFYLNFVNQAMITASELFHPLFDLLSSRSAIVNLIVENCHFTPESWQAFCTALHPYSLMSVKIMRCNLNDHAIKFLMRELTANSLATLQELFLDGNHITALGVPLIADFVQVAPKLTSLSLENNPLDNTSVLALTQGLQKRQAPIDLNLAESQARLTHVGIQVLLKRATCVQRLNLTGNSHLNSMKIIKHACEHPNLNRLFIRRTAITDLSVKLWLNKPRKRITFVKNKKLHIEFPHHELQASTRSDFASVFIEKPVILLIKPELPR